MSLVGPVTIAIHLAIPVACVDFYTLSHRTSFKAFPASPLSSPEVSFFEDWRILVLFLCLHVAVPGSVPSTPRITSGQDTL